MRSLLGLGGRLVAVAGLLVLILAGTGALIVHGPGQVRGWDTDAERWLADHRTGGLVRLTEAATYLADTWTVIAATAALAAVAGWWTRRWWLPAGVILLTGGETAVYELSNTLVDRPRPAVPRLDQGDPLASFPSGHTAAAVCLYGGLALVLRRLATDARPGRPAGSGGVGQGGASHGGTGHGGTGHGGTGHGGTGHGGTGHGGPDQDGLSHASVGRGGSGHGGHPASARSWWVGVVLVVAVVAAVAVPVLVGFCRTYRGMHHPSDVLGGAFLGACWLAAVHRVVLARMPGTPNRRGQAGAAVSAEPVPKTCRKVSTAARATACCSAAGMTRVP
ncbi:phosphatase PAP2 family protein [Frankia sp. QA3]|uniref:phosphatase PAP2 family protein n=1 Tax=Frankia sp. QA3 TaxID=710111 RepID=UPI000269BF25|nr:phosphatase PAP2 family protein [Frankia sp. QA3]EIV91494.1 membrane-associated phospholipid phosphatase [Frankia sp. QA3]